MIAIIWATLLLSVVQYRHRAKDAKYSFVLFLKMGRLPLNQKRKKNAFENKYDVIYGNYVIAYPGRTDFIKTEHWFLKPKTALATDKCQCSQEASKNWKELAESALCHFYFCPASRGALLPKGKETNHIFQCRCFPTSASWILSYRGGGKKRYAL